MPDLSGMFENKNLSGKWLEQRGGQMGPLTITRVEIKTFNEGNEETQKPVIHFRETDKQLTVNGKRFRQISRFAGVNSDTWGGQVVQLFTEPGNLGPEVVVQQVVVQQSAPPQQPVQQPPPAQPAAAQGTSHVVDEGNIPF